MKEQMYMIFIEQVCMFNKVNPKKKIPQISGF